MLKGEWHDPRILLDLNQRPPGYECDQLQALMPSLNKLTYYSVAGSEYRAPWP